MNKSFVNYVIQDYTKPMGVATYKTSKDMSEDLRKALPDIEDLKNCWMQRKMLHFNRDGVRRQKVHIDMQSAYEALYKTFRPADLFLLGT